MAKQRKSAKGSGQRGGTNLLFRMGAIPLLVVFLIIVIMVVDRQSGDKAGDTFSGAQAPLGRDGQQSEDGDEIADMLESDPGEESQSGNIGDGSEQTQQTDSASGETEQESLKSADPSQYPLLQDALAELTGLVQSYCQAKKECNPDLLAQVFDMEDWTEEEKSEQQACMELVKASIKSYENISCYSVEGPETDSYVIFPYYEVRYREAETLMPVISWAYVRRKDNGQYYMVQNTDEAINEYIKKVGEKPEVRAVMTQVQARQKEAVASDAALEKIYGNGDESVVVVGKNEG